MPPVYRLQPARRVVARHRRHYRLHRYRQLVKVYRNRLSQVEQELVKAKVGLSRLMDADLLFGICAGVAAGWLISAFLRLVP